MVLIIRLKHSELMLFLTSIEIVIFLPFAGEDCVSHDQMFGHFFHYTVGMFETIIGVFCAGICLFY